MPRLSDDAIVVRGGSTTDPDAVLSKVQDAIEDGDGPVLSVYCAELADRDKSAAVLAACVGGDLPHSQVLVTTAGQLRAAGFELRADNEVDPPSCHHDVLFGNDPTLETVGAFIACFDGPIPNPTGGKRRRGGA